MIKLTRIDYRLIHGQVAMAYTVYRRGLFTGRE